MFLVCAISMGSPSPNRGARYHGIGSRVSTSRRKTIPATARARIGGGAVASPREFVALYREHREEWEEAIRLLEGHRGDVFPVEGMTMTPPREVIAAAIEQEAAAILDQEMDFTDTIDAALTVDTIPTLHELEQEYMAFRKAYVAYYCYSPTQKEHEQLRRENALTEDMIHRHAAAIAEENGIIPLDDPELLLRIAVYDCNRQALSQEFIVLGSQKLSDLRDRLQCLSDDVYDAHVGGSSYFLIEGVFYDDTRPRADGTVPVPLSREPMAWVREKKRYAQPILDLYTTASMEDTAWIDLPAVRINAMYTFCHQGKCTHTVVVTEMRLAHASDIDNQRAYPLLVYEPKLRRRKCGVCGMYAARFVTYNDRLAPESPFFFCSICYDQFHYDDKDQLLYSDFEVFDYHHE